MRNVNTFFLRLVVAVIAFFLFVDCNDFSHNREGRFVKIEVYDLKDTLLDNCQSPININSRISTRHFSEIEIHINETIDTLIEKEHTIELELKNNSFIRANSAEYTFKQMHFHTPSEHTVNRQRTDMELHIVGVKDNAVGDDAEYLVLGILFVEGKHNKFVQEVIDDLVETAHKNIHEDIVVDVHDNLIHLDDLFGSPFEENLKDIYHYQGSLTTHPFTESVNWYVLGNTVEASKAQIQIMRGVEGENARRTQELDYIHQAFRSNI